MHRLSLPLALLLLLPSLALGGDAALLPDTVLFVGNSYTGANAPNHLGESYQQLVLEGQPELSPLSIETLAPGGYTLARHYADAQGPSVLTDFLTDEDPAHLWDAVVLQDQSQLPGFPQTHPDWLEGRDAAVGLARFVTERGGEPLLLLTYGRRDGDLKNSGRFPDFETMNALLATGYEGYAEAILADGMEVRIIPAGIAWAKIHSDEIAAGNDPLAEGSLFGQLYSGDGSHPSPLGTFLMACATYITIQGASCEDLEWPHSALSVTSRATLSAAATWSVENYVQPGESGGDDDDVADDDDDDDDSAGNDDSGGNDDDSASGGCTCSEGPNGRSSAARAMLIMLLALGGIRGRQYRRP